MSKVEWLRINSVKPFGPEPFGPELTVEGLTAEGLTAEGLTAERQSSAKQCPESNEGSPLSKTSPHPALVDAFCRIESRGPGQSFKLMVRCRCVSASSQGRFKGIEPHAVDHLAQSLTLLSALGVTGDDLLNSSGCGGIVQAGHKLLGNAGAGAHIAADHEGPAVFAADQRDVPHPGFGAAQGTARHGHFELARQVLSVVGGVELQAHPQGILLADFAVGAARAGTDAADAQADCGALVEFQVLPYAIDIRFFQPDEGQAGGAGDFNGLLFALAIMTFVLFLVSEHRTTGILSYTGLFQRLNLAILYGHLFFNYLWQTKKVVS